MFRLVREASRDIALCTIDSSNAKCKIGRDPKTCAVSLGIKAVAVSREHAELQWCSNGVNLVDTSSFGTIVDGVKILKKSILLKGGERLKIGQENFVLEKIEEVGKVPHNQIKKPVQSKPVANSSITSYFTKKNVVLQEESQPVEVSVGNILAAQTPSESQESQKVPCHSTKVRKPVRGAVRRVNPLFDFDEEDESILDNAKRKVLAAETPSDSAPSQSASAMTAPPPVLPPVRTVVTTITPASTPVDPPVEKKKKVSLFAKPSQRSKTPKPIVLEDNDDIVEVTPRKKAKTSLFAEAERRKQTPVNKKSIETHLPNDDDNGELNMRYDYSAPKPVIADDDIVELDVDVSPSNRNTTSQCDDGFARPSLPSTRSKAPANRSIAGPSTRGGIARITETASRKSSDNIMHINASSIPTQVIPPIRKPIVPNQKDAGELGNEPPRKKAKTSLFAEAERRKQRLERNKPKEKSLLDEDGNGELNIRYDYVAPKPVIGERAYSSIENLRAMEQMGREATARFEKRCGLDKFDEDMETQYPSVEELTSILCSSHTEERVEEEEKEEKEVERVGDETLDEEIKSQLVKFCDNLVVSQQPSFDSMASVNPSQGKGFKKFKKAKQGRFATQCNVFSSIIGGSDLVDFRIL